MARPRLLLAAVLTTAAVLTPLSAFADTIPTAQYFDGTPTVGAIFRGPLADGHECSASVIASPSRDLVLTAAHCVYGNPAGWTFVPGYVEGRTPYGVWTVASAYVDPRWQKSEDTRFDYAILRIAPQRIHGRTKRIQDVTGANLLGTAPRTGTPITDVAYNAGVDDQPITCTVPAYYTDGYPGFDCGNYQGGVSGSPLLSGHGKVRVVRGVIGGLHQGGCFDTTSYSSPFTTAVYRLLARAATHRTPDVVRQPGSDGC